MRLVPSCAPISRVVISIAPGIKCSRARKSLPPKAVYAAEALVIDATNVLCAAAADRKRWAHAAPPPLPTAFGQWLTLLAAASQARVLVAVFDDPEVRI
jgi:hypothetical protein